MAPVLILDPSHRAPGCRCLDQSGACGGFQAVEYLDRDRKRRVSHQSGRHQCHGKRTSCPRRVHFSHPGEYPTAGRHGCRTGSSCAFNYSRWRECCIHSELFPVCARTFPGDNSYLAAQHADGSYIGRYTGATAATPGEVITLWGTGFGPANPPVPAGQIFSGVSKLANDVTVTIGGQPAIVDFAGVVGAGLVQINVHVPSSMNDGDAVVQATVNGVSTPSAGNLITVHN